MTAWEDQGVYSLQGPPDRAVISPGLGGASARQATSHALGRIAWLAVVFPEQMHRTGEPVLVCRHQSDGAPPHIEDAGPANKGNIVEMDDIGVDVIEFR